MKIYVAGNFAEDRARCRSIARRLESFGHEITWKWFDTEPAYYGGHNALHDLAGVRDADLLIALLRDERKWQGTWCEIGGALITGKPVFVIGDLEKMTNVFCKHPLMIDFIDRWYFPQEIQPILDSSFREFFYDDKRNGHKPGQSCQMCSV